MINVEKLDVATFKVTVQERKLTTHIVSVDQAYYQKLTGGRVEPEVLIRKSFEFLLEREPNTSILSAFELPLIGTYFPEYERTITARIKAIAH